MHLLNDEIILEGVCVTLFDLYSLIVCNYNTINKKGIFLLKKKILNKNFKNFNKKKKKKK